MGPSGGELEMRREGRDAAMRTREGWLAGRTATNLMATAFGPAQGRLGSTHLAQA